MTIAWAKLKTQGRVKDVGIPWNEEESKAIRELKIPADYVRKGVLTLEDYEEAKEEGMTEARPREEVMKEAKELGVNFVPEADTETLEREIEKKKVAEKKEEVKKNVEKNKKRVKKT